MTEQLNEVGMTDEAFVAEYVAKAQVSIEDADAWVREINGGAEPTPEMIDRLTPAVLTAMGAQVAAATEVSDQAEVLAESDTEASEDIVEAE